MGKLNLEIIEKYDLPKKSYNPDWDDSGYEFTLPSGITLYGLYRCNNSPIIMDSLEGMDGFIYISTEEELQEYINLSYEETLEKIKSLHNKFKIENYL